MRIDLTKESKMKNIAKLSMALALLLAADLPVQAAGMDMSGMEMSANAQGRVVAAEAVGVIDEIDPGKGILTITHEPIKSLGWSAMTMDFVLKDKKSLQKLSKGKKIRFEFVQQRGDYVITSVK
jgi:Cu(I)/Ag(I) efflux system membrane fusion protein